MEMTKRIEMIKIMKLLQVQTIKNKKIVVVSTN